MGNVTAYINKRIEYSRGNRVVGDPECCHPRQINPLRLWKTFYVHQHFLHLLFQHLFQVLVTTHQLGEHLMNCKPYNLFHSTYIHNSSLPVPTPLGVPSSLLALQRGIFQSGTIFLVYPVQQSPQGLRQQRESIFIMWNHFHVTCLSTYPIGHQQLKYQTVPPRNVCSLIWNPLHQGICRWPPGHPPQKFRPGHCHGNQWGRISPSHLKNVIKWINKTYRGKMAQNLYPFSES